LRYGQGARPSLACVRLATRPGLTRRTPPNCFFARSAMSPPPQSRSSPDPPRPTGRPGPHGRGPAGGRSSSHWG
jgi:hypothetical protein